MGLEWLAAMRIVLLDDQPARRESVGRHLQAAGFTRLEMAASIDGGLQLLAECSHDGACEVDLLLVGEGLLDSDRQRLTSLLAWHPAWRHVVLLALASRDRVGAALVAHGGATAVGDVVGSDDRQALVARVVAGLKQRRERLRTALASDITDAIILHLDTRGRVLTINRGGCELLGYRHDELAGRDWFGHCVPAADVELRTREFRQALTRTGPDSELAEHRVVTITGEERIIAWRHYPWRSPGGEVQGLLCSGQDVTACNHVRNQLRWHACHDLLTSLLNRSEFEIRLLGAVEQARQESATHALAYLDIDQFKIVNDTCGYEAGDELLRQLGGLLPEQLQPGDLVARLGGDQFAVLMHDCGIEDAYAATAGVAAAIDAFRFLWQGRAHRVGASIGLVVIDDQRETTAAVLGAAEAACHAAKQRGGGRVHVYQPDDAELVARQGEMQWVLRINRALDEGRFQLWLQAMRRVDSGEEDHCELLLRMLDEDGSVVMPGAFLPAAERFHLSTRIDRWVILHAFQAIGASHDEFDAIALCCINLSGLSLSDESFLDFTVRELRRQGIPGHRICFEITETAAIGNLSGAIRFIRALKAEGVRFALDDFGSGLSSFAYLKTLPVDFLKIDGVFVKDIAEDAIDYAMVKSIHEVALVMGKETVGEFVESLPVLDCLRDIGVHYAQGYAVSRPRRLLHPPHHE